jgi:hypothetical protein
LNLTIGKKFTHPPQLQLSKKFTLDSQDLPSYENVQKPLMVQQPPYQERYRGAGVDELLSPTKNVNSKK